jgi:hypothetical protein
MVIQRGLLTPVRVKCAGLFWSNTPSESETRQECGHSLFCVVYERYEGPRRLYCGKERKSIFLINARIALGLALARLKSRGHKNNTF